jgi:hypothetical protein
VMLTQHRPHRPHQPPRALLPRERFPADHPVSRQSIRGDDKAASGRQARSFRRSSFRVVLCSEDG